MCKNTGNILIGDALFFKNITQTIAYNPLFLGKSYHSQTQTIENKEYNDYNLICENYRPYILYDKIDNQFLNIKHKNETIDQNNEENAQIRNSNEMCVEEMQARILKYLKMQAEIQFECEFNECLIAVPSSFNCCQKKVCCIHFSLCVQFINYTNQSTHHILYTAKKLQFKKI